MPVELPVAARARSTRDADTTFGGVEHRRDVETRQPGFELVHEGLDLVDAGGGADGQGDEDVPAAVGGLVANQSGTAGCQPFAGLGEIGVDLATAVDLAVEVECQQRGAALVVEVDGGHLGRQRVAEPAGLEVRLGVRVEHLDPCPAGLAEPTGQCLPHRGRRRRRYSGSHRTTQGSGAIR